MQFLYGDRELLLSVTDLLSTSVEVIACPATTQLEPDGLLAKQIHQRMGSSLQQERKQLINEYGDIAPGMAVYTTAGDLPYQAVIHAVGSDRATDQNPAKLMQAVTHSLLLCEINGWASVAFPALGAGADSESIATSAQAMHHAITHFCDARLDSAVMSIVLCINETALPVFIEAFRAAAFAPLPSEPSPTDTASEDETFSGELDLSDYDETEDADQAILEWFK